MKNSSKKYPYVWAISYGLILVTAASAVLLKTFVIKEKYIENIQDGGIYAETDNSADDDSSDGTVEAVITDTSYTDDNITIYMNQKTIDDTQVYIVDVILNNVLYLKTALADDTYGKNVKQTTSEMAEDKDAILAINGDFYGYRDEGYVLRNGVLYRDSYDSTEDDIFVVYEDGNCDIMQSGDASAQSLLDNGAIQILSFGPGLVENGAVTVDENDEVSAHMASNPRTAIGMVDPLHYVFVVSDGRTDDSVGLTLYELAQVMKEHGCTEAYNLDGGGSSTLWFNGEVLNVPTNGYTDGEREVSDIVYIGY